MRCTGKHKCRPQAGVKKAKESAEGKGEPEGKVLGSDGKKGSRNGFQRPAARRGALMHWGGGRLCLLAGDWTSWLTSPEFTEFEGRGVVFGPGQCSR